MEFESQKISQQELKESKYIGLYKSIDGSDYGTQAETDLADERHLSGRSGDLTLNPALDGQFASEDGNRYATRAEANLATEYHQIAVAQRAQRSNTQGQA